MIDDEHRELFAVADRLYNAMKTGGGKDAVQSALNALLSYTRYHFQREQELMRRAGFPEYEEHKAEHDRFTSQVAEYQIGLESGQIALSVQMLHFLKNWLANHICIRDVRFSSHLASQRKAAG